jgi:hypothetical protein
MALIRPRDGAHRAVTGVLLRGVRRRCGERALRLRHRLLLLPRRREILARGDALRHRDVIGSPLEEVERLTALVESLLMLTFANRP